MSNYKGAYVNLSLDTQKSIVGYIFDVRDENVVLVTNKEKKVIPLLEIRSVDVLENEKRKTGSEEVGEYNALEKAIISGEHDMVQSLIENNENLIACGYDEMEIKQLVTAVKMPLPWKDDENAGYNQARRIFEFQKNKNGIAKKLFLECTRQSKIPGKLKAKAISSLLDIARDSLTFLEELYQEFGEYIIASWLFQKYDQTDSQYALSEL